MIILQICYTNCTIPFSLIGLTETKLKHNQHSISNVTLKGYRFVSQPSNPNAGGVGFFVKDNIKHTLRIDLTVTKNEFEALWVEVQNDSQHNMLCGIIYRHPSSNLDIFQDYISSSIEKIHRENKYCMIMGDFNLDLLKFESHAGTDAFMNTLGTSFFKPYVLQPTRVTDHSANSLITFF